MAAISAIEWTEATWNPVTGCRKVSAGCDHCYAIRDTHRMAGNPNPKVRAAYEGLTQIQNGRLNWTGKVRTIQDRLSIPFSWKRPRTVFVNSQSDLFHEAVPDEFLDQVFGVMLRCPRHRFQVLTKRPERMREYVTGVDRSLRGVPMGARDKHVRIELGGIHADQGGPVRWPLFNVWLGTSIEDGKQSERLWHLAQTPAAVRFLSCEPLLGDVAPSLESECISVPWAGGQARGGRDYSLAISRIGWIIGGGESGPEARPCHPAWARSLRDLCRRHEIPFFWKQWGEYVPFGQHGAEYTGAEYDRAVILDGQSFMKVGKKRAGRLLDDQEWSQFPEVP